MGANRRPGSVPRRRSALRRGPRSGNSVNLQPTIDTLDNLQELVKGLSYREIQHAAAEGAEVIAEEARRRVPRKTGLLKENIVVRTEKRGRPVHAYVGVIYGLGGAPHAHLVEYGTARGGKPHPFIRPAMSAKKQEAQKVIIESIAFQIDKRLK